MVSTTFHPLNTMDFSSYLLRAQSSGANMIGVASAGGDLINLLKQAGEFGLSSDKKLKLVPYVMEITDIKSMGLERARGLTFATMAYWAQNDATRAWTDRWQKLGKFSGPPTSQHLTSYIATMHYLEAVKAAGTFDGKVVNRKMRELPVKSDMLKNAHLRPEDGRVVYDMLQVVVKSPAESKGPNDLYKVVGTIPRDKSFRRSRGKQVSARGVVSKPRPAAGCGGAAAGCCAGARPSLAGQPCRSNTAMLSTCAVCGNMLTTLAAVQR